jgi:PAS domain S-box-containing protein
MLQNKKKNSETTVQVIPMDNTAAVCYHRAGRNDLRSRTKVTPKKFENNNVLILDQILSGLGPALFSSIRAPFGIFDSNRRIVWINKAMAAIHGCDQETAIGKMCREIFRGCEHRCADCCLVKAIAEGRTQVAEEWMDVPGYGRRWGEMQTYPVRDRNKNVSAVIVIIFETTNRTRVFQRQKKYSEWLEQQLWNKEKGAGKVSPGGDVTLSVKLTRRETEVLRLITEGYTNVQIAEVLNISAHTVKTHVTSLFNKFGVNDRTQAAVLAARHRLL